MSINDQAITRISSLEISGSETANNGFYTPQLTQAQINAIPPAEVQIGGIVYNSDTQELQYFSPALQWVNVTSDESSPNFIDVTVSNTTHTNNLTATGSTSLSNLTIPISGGLTVYGSTNLGFTNIQANLNAEVITAFRICGYETRQPTVTPIAGGTASVQGSELAGQFTFAFPGTVLSSNLMATFTLYAPMPKADKWSVIFSPASQSASAFTGTYYTYTTITSATQFTLSANVNGLTLGAPSNPLVWNYMIMGTN